MGSGAWLDGRRTALPAEDSELGSLHHLLTLSYLERALDLLVLDEDPALLAAVRHVLDGLAEQLALHVEAQLTVLQDETALVALPPLALRR